MLVVSACSRRKLGDPPEGAGGPPPTARDRYFGRAHLRVREAVDRWRHTGAGTVVAWSIVSAGLGLVEEDAAVPHYEATFVGLGKAATRERGLALGLPGALHKRLRAVDLALFVLPLAYLRAAGAPFASPVPQLYFGSPAFARESGAVTIVPCGVDDARELSVSPREVAAARFALFVDDVIAHGLRTALAAWGRTDTAA